MTHASNALVASNTAVTNTMLNVATDSARQSLIDLVRSGEFGDIIHSEPAVVVYTGPETLF